MIYLLDTDTLIHLIRGLKRRGRDRPKAERLEAHCQAAQRRSDVIGLSAITLCELEFGARRSRDYATEADAVRLIISPFKFFEFDVAQCPIEYGRVRETLEKSGRPIGAMDLLLSAHALALDATIVTSNTSHFARIEGLRVENWWQAG